MHESSTTTDHGREHASLAADLTKLRVVVRPGSTAQRTEVCSLLVATRLHLAKHFELEEQHGWIDQFRQQGPRWENALAQLVHEHRQLEGSLETLIQEANAADRLNDEFRQKVMRWIERVVDHETREDDLVERAYMEDLGAGD